MKKCFSMILGLLAFADLAQGEQSTLTQVGDSVVFEVVIRNRPVSFLDQGHSIVRASAVDNSKNENFCSSFGPAQHFYERNLILKYDADRDQYQIKVSRKCFDSPRQQEFIEDVDANRVFNSAAYQTQMSFCRFYKGQERDELFQGQLHHFCNYENKAEGVTVEFADIPFGIFRFERKTVYGSYQKFRLVDKRAEAIQFGDEI